MLVWSPLSLSRVEHGDRWQVASLSCSEHGAGGDLPRADLAVLVESRGGRISAVATSYNGSGTYNDETILSSLYCRSSQHNDDN